MIEPYIMLSGQALDAIEFYEKIFGGTNKRIMRWSDAPADSGYPIDEMKKDWVMHGEIVLCGTNFSISDSDQEFEATPFISLIARFETVDEVEKAYEGLVSGGGQALMEISPTFYAKMYAWVQDKFGVGWQLICE